MSSSLSPTPPLPPSRPKSVWIPDRIRCCTPRRRRWSISSHHTTWHPTHPNHPNHPFIPLPPSLATPSPATHISCHNPLPRHPPPLTHHFQKHNPSHLFYPSKHMEGGEPESNLTAPSHLHLHPMLTFFPCPVLSCPVDQSKQASKPASHEHANTGLVRRKTSFSPSSREPTAVREGIHTSDVQRFVGDPVRAPVRCAYLSTYSTEQYSTEEGRVGLLFAVPVPLLLMLLPQLVHPGRGRGDQGGSKECCLFVARSLGVGR